MGLFYTAPEPTRGFAVGTCHADVAGLEVRHQFGGAAGAVVQGRVGNADGAELSAGTAPVQLRQHVGVTAECSVVLADAARQTHAAVASRPHHDHAQVGRMVVGVIGGRRRAAAAAGVEPFPLTVLAHLHCITSV